MGPHQVEFLFIKMLMEANISSWIQAVKHGLLEVTILHLQLESRVPMVISVPRMAVDGSTMMVQVVMMAGLMIVTQLCGALTVPFTPHTMSALLAATRSQ